MLTPSEQWTWHYCPQQDRLLLDIDDQLQFSSELSAANLNDKPVRQPFSLAEAEAFWRFHEALQPVIADDALRFELCLHALANRYRQLSAHKSWYFATQRAQDSGLYQLVQLQGKDTLLALVVASDLECVECLLLEDGESLAGKQLSRHTVIRVLRNRALPAEVDVGYARTA